MFCAKDKPSCNLETRAEKGKFVGFSELSGGVLMYLPEEGCVITRAYSDCLFLEPAVTPTRGSQPDLNNPATPLSRDNSPPPPSDPLGTDPHADSRGSLHGDHTSIPAPVAGNSRTTATEQDMDLENSTQNSSNIADEPPGDGHTRPIRSNRNKLPSHLNDFVFCEEEDL